MARMAVDATALARFRRVLDEELGHGLAFAVERGKIAANIGGGPGRIEMDEVEPGLAAAVSADSLDAALARHRAALREAAAETFALAGCAPAAVAEVILVGGSSLMRLVRDTMQGLFPQAEIRSADAFTAVIDGLALATEQGAAHT
jgi:hypothetical chaperone protein